MYYQDQIKKSGSSGHDNHGVHLCNKCGWPFQKPHPSAKHRRAHKKVCGTIEGYKLIESDARRLHISASDDEHASDDDRRTPSPKIEKRNVKEFVSSGGLRTMSNKSEDDMYLDADTEFPDSGVSQGMEERIREPNKEVEKLLKTDLNESHLLKADATAETSIPLSDTKESSQEVVEIAKDQSEIGKLSQDTRIEEFPTGSSGMVVASLFHSSHMKFETPIDVSIDEINAKADEGAEQEPGVNENEDVEIDITLTDSTDPHVKAVRDGSTSEFNFEETGKQASDALTEERESELEETKGDSSDFVTLEAVVQEPVTTDGNVELMKAENDAPETNMVKSDLSPLAKPLEDMQDSAADLIQVIGGSGYGKIVEVNERREEGKDEMQGSNAEKEQEDMMVSDSKEQKKEDTASNLNEAEKDDLQLQSLTNQKEATNCHMREEEKQNVHSLSVPHDLPVIDNVESMIEGFKDHHMLKSTLPLDLGPDEVIMSAHDDKKYIISQESSSADLNDLKHDLKQKGVEKPIEGNDDVSGLIIGSGEGHTSCSLEVPTVPMAETRNIIQKDVSSEGFHLHSIESDPLQNAHSEDATVDKLTTDSCEVKVKQTTKSCEVEDGDNNEMNKSEKRVVAKYENTKEPIHSEDATVDKLTTDSCEVKVKQTTESCQVEDDDNNEMNKSEKCVVARNENTKEPLDDELSANIIEHVDSSSISEDNQTIGSPKEDGSQDHERAEVVVLNIARCESTEVVGGGEKLVRKTEAADESAEKSPKPYDLDSVPDKVANAEGNTEHKCSSLLKYADESSQGASQVFGTGNNTNVLDSVGFTAKCIEGNYDDSLLASNENPVDSTSKEATPLHVESELLNNSSATIEVIQTVKSASDCNSDPSQDEGDNKFENQHEGVSMIDKSVASSSRADSLEANWGSVSETTANSDAGILPFLISQPPEKLEINLQMPEDATNECHPDKSDVFEPPTVMTSVESGDCVAQEAALEIPAAPIIQQQEPEDLQAGLAPSLANVENESEGGKKNEEIIAQVSSRSPLKNLLGEAKSPNSKQVPPATLSDASVTKTNNAAVTTVNAILRSEEPNDHQASSEKEMNKEWNSPARYPSEIKKEKRKGKPYWVPFVCCSSAAIAKTLCIISSVLTPNLLYNQNTLNKPLLSPKPPKTTTTFITYCSSLSLHHEEHQKPRHNKHHFSPLQQSHSFSRNETILERLKKKGSDPVEILKEDGDWSNQQLWAVIRLLRNTSRAKDVVQVFDYWKNMDRSRVNHDNYKSVIAILVDEGLIEAAVSFLVDMKIHGLRPSLEVYNLIVHGYAKKGRFSDALSYLKEMEDAGMNPDTETCDMLVQAYADYKMYDEMVQCLKNMESKGCFPDHVTYNLLIREFARAGLVKKMESTHQTLLSKRMDLQSSTLIAMVEAYVNLGIFDKMERLLNCVLNSKTCLKEDLIRKIAGIYIKNHMFSRLDELGIHLSSKTGSTDLVWCLRMLSHACVLSKKGMYSVIQEMESNEFPWNVTVANIIALAYVKMRDFKHLNLLLSELPSRYVKPDIVTVALLLDACMDGFDGKCVKNIWRRVGFFDEDVEMNTDGLVLTSFGKGQFLRSFEEIYSSLGPNNIEKVTRTYNDLINLVVNHYRADPERFNQLKQCN